MLWCSGFAHPVRLPRPGRARRRDTQRIICRSAHRPPQPNCPQQIRAAPRPDDPRVSRAPHPVSVYVSPLQYRFSRRSARARALRPETTTMSRPRPTAACAMPCPKRPAPCATAFDRARVPALSPSRSQFAVDSAHILGPRLPRQSDDTQRRLGRRRPARVPRPRVLPRARFATLARVRRPRRRRLLRPHQRSPGGSLLP